MLCIHIKCVCHNESPVHKPFIIKDLILDYSTIFTQQIMT